MTASTRNREPLSPAQEYRRLRDWTGLTHEDFEARCRSHLVHGSDTAPSDWIAAAQVVRDDVYEEAHGLTTIEARMRQADALYNRDYGAAGQLRT